MISGDPTTFRVPADHVLADVEIPGDWKAAPWSVWSKNAWLIREGYSTDALESMRILLSLDEWPEFIGRSDHSRPGFTPIEEQGAELTHMKPTAIAAAERRRKWGT